MSVTVHKSDQGKNRITFSDSAAGYVRRQLQATPDYPGVRFKIDKRGCSGYAYVIEACTEVAPDDHVFQIDENYQVFVDPKSFLLLKGTHIDFVRDGLNEKYIFTNPNEQASCGCGESFMVDSDT